MALVQIYTGKTVNESVTYKYGNVSFAAQVERKLDVSFRTGRDLIMVKCLCSQQYVPAVDY